MQEVDTPGAGTHASDVSAVRATGWSLAHLPLLGCIFWISSSLSRLLAVPHLTAPHGRWQLCAAFTCYLAIATAAQMMHRGSGRGSRRMGKTRRMLTRAAGMAVLVAAQIFLGVDDGELDNQLGGVVVTATVNLGWLSMLAAVELVGMQPARAAESLDLAPSPLVLPSPMTNVPVDETSVAECRD